jgi:hypothetical protein
MDEVEGLEGVTGVEDARDVDLVRALADHLDVHIFLRERCEHTPGDSDHISHLLSYHRQDRHVAMHGHLKRGVSAQATHTAPQGCKGQGIFRTPVSGFFGFDFGRREARGEGRGGKRRRCIRTMPIFSRSRTRRACSFRSSMSSIAMLTKTSLVLIRSTTTPKRSSVAEYPREEAVRDALPVRLYVQHGQCAL